MYAIFCNQCKQWLTIDHLLEDYLEMPAELKVTIPIFSCLGEADGAMNRAQRN